MAALQVLHTYLPLRTRSRLQFGWLIVGLIGGFSLLTNQMRLPHDIIVEEGLEPNPVPSSSRSTGDSQEKRRRLQELPEEEEDANKDKGYSPGYYKLGKGEVEGNRTEEEQGKRGKCKKLLNNPKLLLPTRKEKLKNRKIKRMETIFKHPKSGNREQGKAGGKGGAPPRQPHAARSNQQTKNITTQ